MSVIRDTDAARYNQKMCPKATMIIIERAGNM